VGPEGLWRLRGTQTKHQRDPTGPRRWRSGASPFFLEGLISFGQRRGTPATGIPERGPDETGFDHTISGFLRLHTQVRALVGGAERKQLPRWAAPLARQLISGAGMARWGSPPNGCDGRGGLGALPLAAAGASRCIYSSQAVFVRATRAGIISRSGTGFAAHCGSVAGRDSKQQLAGIGGARAGACPSVCAFDLSLRD